MEDIEENVHQKHKPGRAITCYMSRRFSTHIISMLELAGDEDLLVLGCGMARMRRTSGRFSPEVRTWSTDISLEMIRRAVLNETPSTFAVAAAEACRFRQLLRQGRVPRGHRACGRPGTMVREIARVLKPGGLAVITTENETSLALPNDRFKAVRKAVHAVTGNTFVEPYFGYKDEAPAPAELRAMAERAGLEPGRTVFDGALYHTLPRISKRLSWINPVAVAHTASALENGFLAPWFCDQYKMVLRKPMSAAPTREPGYTLPGGGPLLVRDGDVLACPETGARFAVTDGVPDLVGGLPDGGGGGESAGPAARPDNAAPAAGRIAAMGRRWTVSWCACTRTSSACWAGARPACSRATPASCRGSWERAATWPWYIALGLEKNI